MAVDSFSHSSSEVLNDLDPLSRALLDLSVQRGMDDGEIAGVLGTDAESVFEVRVGLLRTLAEKVAPEHVDADVPELQAVIAERLYADPEPAEPPVDVAETPEADDEFAVEADDLGDEVDEAELSELPTETTPAAPVWAQEASEKRPEATAPRKRRSPLVFLAPLLLLVAIAAGIVALAGGDDDTGAEPTAQQPPAAQAAGKPADAKPNAGGTRLTAIGDSGARGTASIKGDRLTLKLGGLSNASGGSYAIWLYDSIIDAKSLGASRDSKVDLNVKLPPNAKDYEYIDVSLEPADGNRNHSGQSVLRVPLEKLR